MEGLCRNCTLGTPRSGFWSWTFVEARWAAALGKIVEGRDDAAWEKGV